MIEIWLSAFFVGLLGAGHCLGMCGGITLAIGLNKTPTHYQFFYHLGRILSYSFIGLIFGSLGLWLPTDFGPVMRLVSGILLLLLGFYLADWWKALAWLENAGSVVWRYITPLAKQLVPITSLKKAISAGVLWGWLPCGLVYSVLSLGIATGTPLLSASTMAFFGIGTLPALILATSSAQLLQRFLKAHSTRIVLALLVIASGLWTLYGAWQMMSMGH